MDLFDIAAMQSQLVCSGCRSILLYPGGATNVCCALCNAVTAVPPPGIFFVISFLLVSNLEHLHVEYLSEFLIKCVFGSLI